MKSASEWGDLALLAQQQAKTQAVQWQPVEDGAFCHDIIDGFSALEVEGGQIVSIRHVSNLDGEAVQLIHDIGDLRLCRRVEPEWLDAPDSEGEWAWKSENGKWIGFVKNTQWGMSYRAITNIANYVYEFLVEEMPMGKWQRLDNLRAAVVDDAVSRLVELKAAANEACKAARSNAHAIRSRAVNWGHLHCSEAQAATNDSGSQSYRVIIEGASPEASGLQQFIADRLKEAGWPDVEVDTEWWQDY